jgi:hypothetical protein
MPLSRSMGTSKPSLAGRDYDWRLPLALAVVIATAGILVANNRIAGIYHDDGIYLASARSIAEDGSYRLIDVPGSPVATKYPPLYPLLLAGVWKLMPDFPANLPYLKAVNALSLAAIGVLTYLWTGQLGIRSRAVRLLAAAMTAFSPGLFWFADMALSEPLFVVLLLATIVIAGDGDRPPTTGRLLLAGGLAALAMLTRTIGVAAIGAVVWYAWQQHGWRWSAIAALPGLAAMGGWLAWRALAGNEGGYLLDYYLTYEPSIWPRLAADPAVALRMLLINIRYYVEAAPLGLGLPGWALIALAVLLTSLGLPSRWWSSGLAIRLAALYMLILIGHPLPIERYLAPLVPIACAAIAAGVERLRTSRSVGRLAIAALVPFLATDVVWLRQFREVTSHQVHGHSGRPMLFPWGGFNETIAWLSSRAVPGVAIASGYDTLFFLYTGHPGVRPWPPRPEVYSPAYAVRHVPPDSSRISAELRRLGVEYLVVGPMLQDGEGKFAREAIAAILTRRDDGWAEVYRSSDGRHVIYRRGRSEP